MTRRRPTTVVVEGYIIVIIIIITTVEYYFQRRPSRLQRFRTTVYDYRMRREKKKKPETLFHGTNCFYDALLLRLLQSGIVENRVYTYLPSVRDER